MVILELLFVYFLCKRMGQVIERKGHNPLPWQVFIAVSWFGGEFFGGLVTVVVITIHSGRPWTATGPDLCAGYIGGWFGGLMAILATFFLTVLVPTRRGRSYEDDYRDYKDKGHTGDDRPKRRKRERAEDEDDDDRPRKRRRSDDDEDDRPRSRRRSDEDDEDNRPRRRRSDDDDEDDRPRRRRSDDRYRE